MIEAICNKSLCILAIHCTFKERKPRTFLCFLFSFSNSASKLLSLLWSDISRGWKLEHTVCKLLNDASLCWLSSLVMWLLASTWEVGFIGKSKSDTSKSEQCCKLSKNENPRFDLAWSQCGNADGLKVVACGWLGKPYVYLLSEAWSAALCLFPEDRWIVRLLGGAEVPTVERGWAVGYTRIVMLRGVKITIWKLRRVLMLRRLEVLT